MRQGYVIPVLGMLLLASTACDDSTSVADTLAPNDSSPDVVLSNTSFDATAGDTTSLDAFVVDPSGHRTRLSDLVWYSSDSAVAVMKDGVMYMVNPGTATLSTSANGTPLSAVARVGNAVAIRSINILPKPLELGVGEKRRLRLMLRYSNNGNIENNLGAVWRSLTPSIASVTGGAEVTGLAAGTGRIVASRGRIADTVEVIVGAPNIAPSLTIAPDTAIVPVGGSTSFAAALSSGEETATGVTWSSSSSSIATVSSTGMVTGKAAGRATIRAERNGQRDSASVLVEAAAAPAPSDSTPAAPAPSEPSDPTDTGTIGSATTTIPPTATGSSVARAAELPRRTVDTRMPAVTGRTIRVPAGGNLQKAIDEAAMGDQILLAPGATYVGYYFLPKKSGSGWITIRTDAALPAEGTRITPAQKGVLAKLVTPGRNQAVIQARRGARGYRIVGVEITATSATTDLNALVRFDYHAAETIADVPSDLVLDRVYIHSHPGLQLIRCVILNAANSAVIDSYLEGCAAKGRDSQAIVSWNTPGPLKIQNNRLEGAGENIMIGGAGSHSAELLPSDIEIRRNHIIKPLAWLASGAYSVKNLLEFKVGRRVLVEDNVIENNWADAQTGRAILIRGADQFSSSPWSRTSDITIRGNILRHSASAFSIDAGGPYETVRRVSITNNLIYDIGDKSLGNGGMIFQVSGASPMEDLAIERNTMLYSTGSAVRISVLQMAGAKHRNFVFRNNLAELGSHGVKGSGALSGTATLNRYSAPWQFAGNVMISTASSLYPASNGFVGSFSAAGLTNVAAGDLRLSASSPLRSASVPAGGDVEGILRGTAGVVR